MNFSPLRKWTGIMAAMVALAGSTAMAQQSTPAPGGALGLDTATSSTKNLLVNGSFEKGTEGWTFDPHGHHGTMALDENEKHGNKPSVRIENTEGDDSHLKQKVTVEPETRYRLEGYIKTKDVRSVKRDGKGGACLNMLGSWDKSQVVNKTKSWTKVSEDIVSGSSTEIEVGGRLGFWGDGVTGTAWFSDLSLVKIGKAPPRR
jgi:hypothetical protein